jgi:hypothetical protein
MKILKDYELLHNIKFKLFKRNFLYKYSEADVSIQKKMD